jgi:hypothetical protein
MDDEGRMKRMKRERGGAKEEQIKEASLLRLVFAAWEDSVVPYCNRPVLKKIGALKWE